MVTVFTFAAGGGDGAAVGFGAAVGDGGAIVGAGAAGLGATVGDGAGWEQAPASANASNDNTSKPATMSLTVFVFKLIPSFLRNNHSITSPPPMHLH